MLISERVFLLTGSLDIQFRLLRADATTSLRVGLNLVLKALDSEDCGNKQGETLKLLS